VDSGAAAVTGPLQLSSTLDRPVKADDSPSLARRRAILAAMVAHDTSQEAHDQQNAVHRRLGPSGRFRIAIELSELTRHCALAGIRMRHVGRSEPEIRAELIRLLHGISVTA